MFLLIISLQSQVLNCLLVHYRLLSTERRRETSINVTSFITERHHSGEHAINEAFEDASDPSKTKPFYP